MNRTPAEQRRADIDAVRADDSITDDVLTEDSRDRVGKLVHRMNANRSRVTNDSSNWVPSRR